MKELAIKRELSEDTRRESVWCLMNGAVECFSLHVTGQGEVILTDHSDYTKIYSVESLDFHRALERSNNDMQFDNIKLLIQNYAKASAAYMAAAAKGQTQYPDGQKIMLSSSVKEYNAYSGAMRELLRAVLDAAGFPNTKIIL